MHTPAPRILRQRTTEVTYPGGTEHIRAVRADLRAVLDGCLRADDVILCASELAANAAQHSRSRLPGGIFTVRAIVSPGHYARIEIQDNGGPWNQAMIDPARHHGLDTFVPSPTSGDRRRPDQPNHLGAIRLPRAVVARLASGRLDGRHVDAVRIFFTSIKGAPSARRA
jgi:histidine kinase-like protein